VVSRLDEGARGDSPERCVPAQVPGAVQLDWARAEGWADFNTHTSFTDFQWMEDVYWLYRARLDFRALQPGERLFFLCEGVDYRFEIRANARALHRQEGMFMPVTLDLTGHVSPCDVLEVLVYPAPKSMREPATRDQTNQSCKPAVSYGWDFHPRLIPLGIWGETSLEIRPAIHLQDAEVSFTLSDDYAQARLQLVVHWLRSRCAATPLDHLRPGRALLVQMQRPLTRRRMRMSHQLTQPALWWPNGQGVPHLYTSTVELLDVHGTAYDVRRLRTGLRRVRLLCTPRNGTN